MAVTYEPIATTTLSSPASTIVFSSIPSTYTDLKIIISALSSSSASVYLRFNSDTTFGNYGTQVMYGDGAVYAATGFTNNSQSFVAGWTVGSSSTLPTYGVADIFSYASSRYKTVLAKGFLDQNGGGESVVSVNVWRSTSAINTVTVTGGLFDTNTTATIFGITAA